LTRRLGDLPEGGDEQLKHMEQVVLKQHNLPEQLRISSNDMPGQEIHLISDLFAQARVNDLLVDEILKAI
jgi:hypothetical protein